MPLGRVTGEKNVSVESTPMLSVVLPVYNEEALLEDNLILIRDYLRSIESEFRWEIVIVNDGSADKSGPIVRQFAEKNEHVVALTHPRNFGLGQALKYGMANTRGDYVITLDIDLSYDVEHIGELARKIRDDKARLVLASPYMKGGSISNVPGLRRMLSILGNRFLRFFVQGHFSTLTSIVRAYDGPYIRAMNLRAQGMDVMPEVVYKSMILRAAIDEVPARLDWGPQLQYQNRRSSMRLVRHVFSTVMSGFLFRPFLFFVFPGILLAIFSLYVIFWMGFHVFESYEFLKTAGEIADPSSALAHAYKAYPHTYIVGLLSTMLSIQLIGLGIVSLQNKRYYEELFHLGSTVLRHEMAGNRDAIHTKNCEPPMSNAGSE